MTDARGKQPDKQLIDLTNIMDGQVFEIDIACWPYGSIKNEDVFARNSTFKIRSESFNTAYQFAIATIKILKLQHDIWETKLTRVHSIGV